MTSGGAEILPPLPPDADVSSVPPLRPQAAYHDVEQAYEHRERAQHALGALAETERNARLDLEGRTEVAGGREGEVKVGRAGGAEGAGGADGRRQKKGRARGREATEEGSRVQRGAASPRRGGGVLGPCRPCPFGLARNGPIAAAAPSSCLRSPRASRPPLRSKANPNFHLSSWSLFFFKDCVYCYIFPKFFRTLV